jgi:hypothetical protein
MRPKIIYYYISLLIFLSQIAGCVSYQKQKELEKVAKDWCLTIRASQVIPVYPLTEDVQPGDVFLVQTPIQKQAKEYEKKGFLPLDQRMTRIRGFDYKGFYQDSYGIEKYTNTPHHWQFPPTGVTPSKPRPVPPANAPANTHKIATGWHNAPRAGFPTYTVTVQQGSGFQGALPISGIPIGLSLMNAGQASVSVTLKDAYTYGLPLDKIRRGVSDWAQIPENKDMLDKYRKAAIKQERCLEKLVRKVAAKPEPTVFLRVVSRVYLTGRVDVSIKTLSSWGASATTGLFQGFELPKAGDVNAVESYNNMIKALNKTLDVSKPGGTLKIAWAADRSITLDETFDRPLVIGYLGFDFPVMKNGNLGLPVATRDMLTGTQPTMYPPALGLGDRSRTTLVASLAMIQSALNDTEEAQAILYAKRMDSVASLVPEEYGFVRYTWDADKLQADNNIRIGLNNGNTNVTDPPKDDGLVKAVSYRGKLREAYDALNEALNPANMPYMYGSDKIECSDSEILDNLRLQRDEIERVHKDFDNRLISHPDIRTAVNYLPELLYK